MNNRNRRKRPASLDFRAEKPLADNLKIMLKKELIEILACPQCKGEVEMDKEEKNILCRNCQLAYEIRDGIPIMLIDEAKPITDQ